MDTLELIKDLETTINTTMLRVFAIATPEQASWKAPGSTANTIGATFFHTYQPEDAFAHQMLGRPSEFERGGWESRLGYTAETVWAYNGPQDPAQLLEYAKAVSAVTEEFLASVTPQELEHVVETRRGPRPAIYRLGTFLVTHKSQHLGDISALLGCQGVGDLGL